MPDISQGSIRAPGYATDGFTRNAVVNSRGDQSITQGLPPKTDLVRLGSSWSVNIATASAFTYVAAWPTTRAEVILYNGEPSNGKSYVIDSAWMYGITSMAAAQPIALLAQLQSPGATTAPTNSNTTTLINSLSGKAAYPGNARRAVAVTTMVANGWQMIANASFAMTTNLGAGVTAELYGMYVVPPGGCIGFAGVAGTAAGTAIIGFNFHEIALDLG